MTRFHWTDVLVVGLIVFQAMLATIVVANPESLGIPQITLNWLMIVNVGVGVLLNQLKSLGQPPTTTKDDPPKGITP